MTKNLTCLLIDDDEDDREIFALVLRELSKTHVCIMASNAKEGLRILGDDGLMPDFIFLDLNMPAMSGKECLKEIRKSQHLNSIPVVIYSTSTSQSDIEETKQLGADRFISKTHNIDILQK